MSAGERHELWRSQSGSRDAWPLGPEAPPRRSPAKGPVPGRGPDLFMPRAGQETFVSVVAFKVVFLRFRLLIHVPNERLHDQEVWFVRAMDLDAVLVIPLDHAADDLTRVQHHHHRRTSLHLLDVVKILRVGLLRGSWFFPWQVPRPHLVLNFGQRRTD